MKKLLLLLLITICGNAYAQPGSLDLTFGTGGIVTTVQTDAAYAVAIQTDGKIVVSGNSYISGTNTDFALTRYNSNGLLDPSFGLSGIVTTNFLTGFWNRMEFAKSLAIQSDGKIVVAGYTDFYGGYDFAVARYNINGSLDSSFGSGGLVNTNIGGNYDYGNSVAIQKDGKILVAGASEFTYTTGDDFAVVRYTINGSIDSTFGLHGIVHTNIGDGEEAYSLALQSDSKIVLAGYTLKSGNLNFALVRYTDIGTLDPSFGIGGIVTTDLGFNYDMAKTLAIQSDGKIVVAGRGGIGGNYDFALVRYTGNGSLDPFFGIGGIVTTDIGGSTDEATALVLQTDGSIVVAGSSYNAAKNFDFALVRYTTSGSLDPTFGTGGKVTTTIGNDSDQGNSVAIQSDGKIIVVGAAFPPNVPGAGTDYAIVRYNGDGVTGLGEEDNSQVVVDIYPNPFNSSATIQLNLTLNNAELNIFDITGQNIKTIKNISGQTITLYRTDLTSGLYFLQIIQDSRIITKKKLIITD